MTPEEAAKFRLAGAKFMIIPFAIIITVGMAAVISPQVRNFLGFKNYEQPNTNIILKSATVQPKITPTTNNVVQVPKNLPACRNSCMKKTSLGMGYGPSFDYCCPNEGDPLIGAPNTVWQAGANGPGTSAGKTDASGFTYWLLSDGKYHLQVYCPCK